MYARRPSIAVYVGPSGTGVKEGLHATCLERLLWLPPVRRGDLQSLPEYIDTILIADGYFGDVPSVGHLELLYEVERRSVFGCSSIGAIRAFELRNDGMVGLGAVYETFFEFDDFMDDEVALLHAPPPHFWPVSIPLVNVRFALSSLQSAGICSASEVQQVIVKSKDRYFGDRTLQALLADADSIGGEVLSTALKEHLRHHDIKRSDFAFALSSVLGRGSAETTNVLSKDILA